MELDFAFLAKDAALTADGQLWAAGAGFDQLATETYPAEVPPFFIVARFIVAPDDLRRSDKFHIEVVGSDGEIAKTGERLEINKVPKHPIDETKPTGAFVMASVSLGAKSPGAHQFRIFLNDELQKTLTLHLLGPAFVAQ